MRRYAQNNPLRLHTPGHKGKLDRLDITELTDGSFPDEQIKDAEKTVASIYRTRHASLLCGGSSQGVKAAVYAIGQDGLCDRKSHRSVFDGFTLAGKNCDVVGKSDVRPLALEDIKSGLKSDHGVVVLTSPT